MGIAYGVTDEIFGLSVLAEGPLRPAYSYGLIVVSVSGWVLGTVLGAVAGAVLPHRLISALGVELYGMFIAIIIPPARRDRNVLYTLIASFVLSGLCAIAPVIGQWSSGMRTVVLTIVISAVAAWLKPLKINDDDGAA